MLYVVLHFTNIREYIILCFNDYKLLMALIMQTLNAAFVFLDSPRGATIIVNYYHFGDSRVARSMVARAENWFNWRHISCIIRRHVAYTAYRHELTARRNKSCVCLSYWLRTTRGLHHPLVAQTTNIYKDIYIFCAMTCTAAVCSTVFG